MDGLNPTHFLLFSFNILIYCFYEFLLYYSNLELINESKLECLIIKMTLKPNGFRILNYVYE